MNPVHWFEIPVIDIERAKQFYESLFGYSLFLTQISAGENLLFPREEIAAGASGTLVKGERFTPSQQGTVVYFSVEDIEAVCNKAKAAGGSVLVPATPIGDGWGVFAHLLDTEGNKIGVWSKP